MAPSAPLGDRPAGRRISEHFLEADPVRLAGLSPALVVEDDFLAAIDLIRCLDDWGIEARTASRVDAALELAGEMRPKLALIDVNLEGGFEGLSLARELQALYGMKIVYITGYALRDLKDRLAGNDPVAVLFKPIDPEVLAAVLLELSVRFGAAH